MSIYNIGCLLGCIVNYFIGEKIGRKKAMWLAMVLTSVGAIIQCASFHVWALDTKIASHFIKLIHCRLRS